MWTSPLVQCDVLFIEMISCPPMAIVQMTDPYETNRWEVYEMRPWVKRARSALCQHCLLLAKPREDCHWIIVYHMVKYIYGETARIPRDRLHVWLFRGIPKLHNFPNATGTFPSNGCLGNITILYPLWFQESTSLWSWIRPCWHISESTTSGKAFTSSLSSTRWMAVRSSLEPQKTHPFVKDCKKSKRSGMKNLLIWLP